MQSAPSARRPEPRATAYAQSSGRKKHRDGATGGADQREAPRPNCCDDSAQIAHRNWVITRLSLRIACRVLSRAATFNTLHTPRGILLKSSTYHQSRPCKAQLLPTNRCAVTPRSRILIVCSTPQFPACESSLGSSCDLLMQVCVSQISWFHWGTSRFSFLLGLVS